MDEAFRVLQKKEIYEFLNGDPENNDLVLFNGKTYGMPYHTSSELANMCRTFGFVGELGGSRWNYMESLMQFAIEKNRCSELLTFLFSLDHFSNLNSLESMEEIERLY